jgi:RNA polymerase sigma factor (sigma-70 family)
VDISAFINAIRSKNDKMTDELYSLIQNALIDYLKICYRTPFQDAQDAAQDALLALIEIVRSDRQIPEKPEYYLKISARNAYLKMLRKNGKNVGDEFIEQLQPVSSPEEILAKSEMMHLLRLCITKLEEASRKIIEFWLENPGVKAEAIGQEFNLSVSNVWVRKHRINKQLEACIRKRM